jgi:transcriptional regulator with XRE-family HTH domain
MTQYELARLVDVPFETIRSIETGRRRKEAGPSAEVLEKIKLATAATWNPEERLWEFAFKDPKSKILMPFSYAIYLEYRRCLETPPIKELKESWPNAVALKLWLSLTLVSGERWYPLLFKIEKAIAEWRSRFEIEGKFQLPNVSQVHDLKEHIEGSRPAFTVEFNKQTGKIDRFVPLPAKLAAVLPSDYQHIVLDPTGALSPRVQPEKPPKRQKRKS